MPEFEPAVVIRHNRTTFYLLHPLTILHKPRRNHKDPHVAFIGQDKQQSKVNGKRENIYSDTPAYAGDSSGPELPAGVNNLKGLFRIL